LEPGPADESRVKTQATLEEWRAFWKLEPEGSIVGDPQFTGGDIGKRRKDDPESLTPADFHLTKDSPGKDLGADVDRIGPGKPYDEWKKSPEHAEWQKKVRALLDGR